MSEDIASLRIKVDSLEAAVANKRLDGLTRSGTKAERATDGLTSSFSRFVGPAALAASAVAGIMKVTSVTREFDVLNAQLITATGNAENAARAFVAIQDFATQTPYDLQQATEGFTKLVNLGLTPSERAMMSYGDTASAMGKDMIQMVEAVADATTGEFERLKEFGIRSKKEGDNVTFTFRGVKETVKFNAAEIEEYLTKLGENNFAGAMTERMKTLDGAMSNMGDAWDKAFLTISKSGVGDVIETTVRMATSAIEEFTAMLESGELGAYIEAITGQFSGIATAVADAFDFISDLWGKVPGEWKKNGDSAVDAFIFALKHLPIEVETLIKLAAVELAVMVDYAKIYGEATIDTFLSFFDLGVERAKVYGTALKEALDPTTDYDLAGNLAALDAEFNKGVNARIAKAEEEAEVTAQLRRDSVVAIMDERTAALGSFDAQIEKGEKLREKWNQVQEARASATGDRLAEFKVGGEGEGEDGGGTTGGFDDAAIEKLRLSLRTEEEVIQESYDRRLEMLLANTEEGSIQQNELKQRLDAEFAEQALGEFAEDDTFQGELERIQSEFEQRRELILSNTAITEEDRTKLEEKLTNARNNKIADLEKARTQLVVSQSAALFGNLAELAKSAGDEQSKTYKAMFAVSKAFSIADSIMSIQTGIAKAAELGWPAMIPALASVVSTTAGVVSTISGTTFSAHDNGGQIPEGGVGLVGEFGPEFISGPAQVMSRKQTMDAVKGGGGSTVVNFINQVPNTEVEEQRTQDAEGNETIEFIIKQVKDELTTDVQEGGNDFSNALETTYTNMSRSA